MAVKDIGIYFPESSASVFRYHFDQLVGRASELWSYYINADAFINSNHQRRIACFQIPYPYNHSIQQEIDQIYDHVDAVVVLGSELHQSTVDFMRRNDRAKMRWFICGALNPGLDNGRTYQFLDWFITTVHFYKHVRPSTLYSLNPYSVKPLMFDALLGKKKHQRDIAYNFIRDHNLLDKSITTYCPDDQEIDFDKSWQWEQAGLVIDHPVQWTVELVKYYDYRMSLSQVIPLDVYNQTAYSLVSETNCDNNYVFFTEKTVKPILGRRLFVMIAHQHSLKRLQDLGFRTFDGIIDESYDNIEAIRHRIDAALDQIKWLSTQPQEKILAQCRDIVDHNFNLMYGKDWYREFKAPLSRVFFD
jgi:hypothetical protein